MRKIIISELFVYRWRYAIGYGLIAIGLIAILVFSGLFLPGGISNHEMESVINSNSISFSNLGSLAVTNLPYHIIQHISIALFGLSVISIKLPSIIFAFFTAIGLVLLLRHWFKPSIGVLASLIAITTSQFLFIAQDGTPAVLYLFWSVWLILFASLISRQQKFVIYYKIAFFIMAALSLYTPLSFYTLIAIIIALAIHPHLRYIVRHLSLPRIAISVVIGLVLLAPLVYSLIKTPSLTLTLLGIPTQWPDFITNFSQLGTQYFGINTPIGTTIMTPFFGLGSMLLVGLGIYQIIRDRVTAKSYLIILWTVCLIPVIVFNPNFTAITFLPLVLLMASGLNLLLSHWYELFPRNPYARIAGLIPLVALVIALVFSGADRYVYGYSYDPNTVPNFSNDIRLIPDNENNIVVTDDELGFYQVVASHNKRFIVSTIPTTDTFIATRKAKQAFAGYEISRIITTSKHNDADRFYLYKKITE